MNRNIVRHGVEGRRVKKNTIDVVERNHIHTLWGGVLKKISPNHIPDKKKFFKKNNFSQFQVWFCGTGGLDQPKTPKLAHLLLSFTNLRDKEGGKRDDGDP